MLAVPGASVLRLSATTAFAAEHRSPAPRLPPRGSPAKWVEAERSMAALSAPAPITMPRPLKLPWWTKSNI